MITIQFGEQDPNWHEIIEPYLSALETALLAATVYFAYRALNSWRAQEVWRKRSDLSDRCLIALSLCIRRLEQCRQRGRAPEEELPTAAQEWSEEKRNDYLVCRFSYSVLEKYQAEFDNLAVLSEMVGEQFGSDNKKVLSEVSSLRRDIMVHSTNLCEAIENGINLDSYPDSKSFCFRYAMSDPVEKQIGSIYQRVSDGLKGAVSP